MKYEKNVYEGQNVYLQYYEIRNGLKPLVLLHAQAVDSTSYFGVMPKLAQHFHVYAVNCYGHGGSLHDASKYNITDIGNAVISFIQNVIQEPVCLRRSDRRLYCFTQRPVQHFGAGRCTVFLLPRRKAEALLQLCGSIHGLP